MSAVYNGTQFGAGSRLKPTSLCHLGNVATRLGRSFRFDPDTERVLADAEADQLMSRPYRNHWGRPKGA